jgi:hypothetical protein
MTHHSHDELPSLSTIELTAVTGGSAAQIGGQIGSLVDSFTGGKQGGQIGGQIGGLVDSFLGGGAGGAG